MPGGVRSCSSGGLGLLYGLGPIEVSIRKVSNLRRNPNNDYIVVEIFAECFQGLLSLYDVADCARQRRSARLGAEAS